MWIRTMNMRIEGWLTRRLIGGCLMLILAAPTAKAAAALGQEAAPVQQEQSAPSSGAQQAGTDSGKPVASSAQSEVTLPDAPEVAQSSSTGTNAPSGSSQPGKDQPQPNQNQQQPSQDQQSDQQQSGGAQP